MPTWRHVIRTLDTDGSVAGRRHQHVVRRNRTVVGGPSVFRWILFGGPEISAYRQCRGSFQFIPYNKL